MKILALVTECFGGQGGIARATRDFADAMIEIEAVGKLSILPRLNGEREVQFGGEVIQLRSAKNVVVYSLRALIHALRNKPDVVYCNHLNLAPLGMIIGKLVGAKRVVQLHGVEIWSEPSFIQKRALESANQLHCVSRYTRSKLIEACNVRSERAIVINNTFSSKFKPRSKQEARKRFSLAEEDKVLLSVGRLSANEMYKGHDLIIHSLKKIAEQLPSVVYCIAGTGDDESRLKGIAENFGVADKVRFLGFIDEESLPNLYSAADLFVMPSQGEGFGIVFLEAMASGTRALGLNVGGAKDALVDGRLGVLTDAPELDRAITGLLHQKGEDPVSISKRVGYYFGKENYLDCLRNSFEMLSE